MMSAMKENLWLSSYFHQREMVYTYPERLQWTDLGKMNGIYQKRDFS